MPPRLLSVQVLQCCFGCMSHARKHEHELALRRYDAQETFIKGIKGVNSKNILADSKDKARD